MSRPGCCGRDPRWPRLKQGVVLDGAMIIGRTQVQRVLFRIVEEDVRILAVGQVGDLDQEVLEHLLQIQGLGDVQSGLAGNFQRLASLGLSLVEIGVVQGQGRRGG